MEKGLDKFGYLTSKYLYKMLQIIIILLSQTTALPW
jgi:hypothetical protein